jgi:hypothetical protein
MKDVILRFKEFCKAVGNLSLATFFNCPCRWCKKKDEDIQKNKDED